MAEPLVDCRWCQESHAPRYLCDPAQQLLLALYARGTEGNMPTIELPEPLPMAGTLTGLGLDPQDQLLSQLTVTAVIVPAPATSFPGLMFSGRTPWGETLPRWVYAGHSQDLRRVVALVKDTTEMAIRRAREARQRAGGDSRG